MIPLADDRPTRRPAPITSLLIAANVAVFVYQLTLGRAADTFIASRGFVPAKFVTGEDFGVPTCVQPADLTIVTSMFVHGGLLHVGSNMLYLWIFGNTAEDKLGHIRYAILYLVCGVAASLVQTYMTITATPDLARIPTVGASGAIAGVLGAYLVLSPGARIRTFAVLGIFWGSLRVPAAIVLTLWFVTQFFQGVGSLDPDVGANSGVAFWAHVGGFVAGLVLAKLLARQPAGRPRVPLFPF